MYSRFIRYPQDSSFFLFGPRGTGKTTWVRTTFPKAIYCDLLRADLYTRLLADPTRLEELIPKGFTDWIIIDEIQKVPYLLDEVHRLIESKRNKFILTGSSARKLRRGGFNLLAGRALLSHMHPLTAAELGEDFHLEEYMQFGGLPMVFSAEDKTAYLKSYVQTYLQQEITQEGISRNLGSFCRFLETASLSQGSVLNMSEVAREASMGRRMVENYFSALEDLLIAVRVPVFSARSKRRLISHSKFYYFDAGVFNSIRPTSPLDQRGAISGIALETIFLQNLRAINDYFDLGYRIFYWRTVSGAEVDFIAYGNKGFKAFEIKSKRDIHKRDLTGLKSFLADYPEAKGYILYGGRTKMHMEGIEVWPAAEALKLLPEILR